MLSRKAAAVSLALVAAAGIVSTANGVTYEVASCADLAAVDDNTVTEIALTTDTIDCSDYTRFRVRNTMTLSATASEVTFSNVAFKVLGDLTVQPNMVLKDVGLNNEEEKNGGTLYVQEGATATFMGMAGFYNNTVTERELPPIIQDSGGRSPQFVVKKGGALHNKGTIVFEKDATFDNNVADTRENTNGNKGGGISNAKTGTITFKEKLTMSNNKAEGFFSGLGGGIFNRGDIVVEGEAVFIDNSAAEGGGIYQESSGSVTFNGMATFFSNSCAESRGGAIGAFGGKVALNAGSLFQENIASSSGDGGSGAGIYASDGAEIMLGGTHSFIDNSAYAGGGIYLRIEPGRFEPDPDYVAPTLTLPADEADLIFEDNYSEECPQIAYAFSTGIQCEL